jgi:hypothetical protein
MFDPEYASITTSTWGLISTIKSRVEFIYGNMVKSLVRVESRSSSPSMLIGMSFSALICDGMIDDEKKTYAGMRPVSRSIYDIKGRPDADLWMNACDKEVTKLLEMGTFEIVNTEDIPAGNKRSTTRRGVIWGHLCPYIQVQLRPHHVSSDSK